MMYVIFIRTNNVNQLSAILDFSDIHGTLQSTPKRDILEQCHCCHLTSVRLCCCFCWTTWLLQMSPVNCLAYYLSHLFNLSSLLLSWLIVACNQKQIPPYYRMATRVAATFPLCSFDTEFKTVRQLLQLPPV